MIPLCIIPLWDADLAAAEVRRNAARGVRAVAFSEIPPYLGLPSIHSGYWDPFFAACSDTSTIVCMHIGSGSKMPSTSVDAPGAVGSALVNTHGRSIRSSTTSCRAVRALPEPEGDVQRGPGRVAAVHARPRRCRVGREPRWGGVAEKVPNPPSSYVRDHVYFCVFQDKVAFETSTRSRSRTSRTRPTTRTATRRGRGRRSSPRSTWRSSPRNRSTPSCTTTPCSSSASPPKDSGAPDALHRGDDAASEVGSVAAFSCVGAATGSTAASTTGATPAASTGTTRSGTCTRATAPTFAAVSSPVGHG